MKRLPLYRPEEKLTALDRTLPLPRNINCRRCARGGAVTPEACLPPMIQTGHQMLGAIMVVGGDPTFNEAVQGKIFNSAPAVTLRVMIEQLAPGKSFVYDRAVRCPAKDAEDKANDYVEACRPYMKAVVDVVKPERIFAFGGHAHESILGRRPDQDSIRRGYAYMADGTCVFLFKNYVHAIYNKFELEEMKEDIIWALTATPHKPPWEGTYFMVETAADAREAIRAMYDAGKYFTFDLETSGPFRDDGYRLLCGAFSPAGWVNDTFLFTEDCLLIPEVKTLLAGMFLDLWPCGHNLQFDLKHIWNWIGLIDPVNDNAPVFQTKIYCDTMWVIRQRDSRCAKALAFAAEIVGMGGHKSREREAAKGARREIKQRMQDYLDGGRDFASLMLLPNRMRITLQAAVKFLCDVDPKGKNVDMFTHGLIPPDIEHQYCALDTVSTSRLVELWAPLLYPTEEVRAADPEAQRMWYQWHEFTEPVIKVAAQMEIWGLPTDPTVLKMLRKKVDRVVKASEERLRKMGFTADKFTVDTIRAFLFTQLDYPILKHKDALTATGVASTGGPALDLLNRHMKEKSGVDDPVLMALADRAAAEKISSSFTMSIAGRVTAKGLVHHSLMPEGADTGRWSSRDPNTQNMPSHGPWAKSVKTAFRPNDPDHMFIQVDYASMELRDAAGLSMDEKYAGVFLRGEDPHLGTAKLVWNLEGMSPDEMKPWRSKAKCYHADTELLTKSHGWVPIHELVRFRSCPEIAVCKPLPSLRNGSRPMVRTTFERPTDLFTEFHPDEKLISFRGGKMMADVTPDHGMLVWDEDGQPQKVRADELTSRRQSYEWAVTTVYEGDRAKLPENIRALENEQLSGLARCCAIFKARAYYWPERKSWCVMASDGIVAEDFTHAGLKCAIEPNGDGGDRIVILDESVTFIRSMLNKVRHMPLAWWIELPPVAKHEYLSTFWKLSRHHHSTTSQYRRITCTTKIDADLLSAMAATCGLYAEVEPRDNAKHKEPLIFWDVFLDQERDGAVNMNTFGSHDMQRPMTETYAHTEMVGCVTVSSGYVLTRRKGMPLVCGNTVNFGVLFGKQPFSLAPDLGTTEDGAIAIMDSIFGEYKNLALYIQANKDFIAEYGYQNTHWWEDGKWIAVNKRYLTGAGSPDFKARNAADRQATNTDVQGSSALKTTKSCIRTVKWIHESGRKVKLHNAVHDSLILTSHRNEAADVCDNVKRIMEMAQSWKVPTVAEPELGPTWAGMLDLEKLRLFASMVKKGMDDASIAHVMELCKEGKFKPEVVANHRTICERLGLL
jgi:uracil-DNA glycosylase family 4